MALEKPRVMIVLEDNDAITNLAGLLWLKGYEAYKASTAEECLSKIYELGNQRVCSCSNNESTSSTRRKSDVNC
jgi:hypothetical protein